MCIEVIDPGRKKRQYFGNKETEDHQYSIAVLDNCRRSLKKDARLGYGLPMLSD
ncbi:hypothetical protein ACX800_15485 [Paenarthrobacter nitroguajacolicus]|uniref:hypothetical protein n=1 Tax=Paenarthrobacter nitroguajacolicus TaxID=211146 RepID=UPI000A7EC11F